MSRLENLRQRLDREGAVRTREALQGLDRSDAAELLEALARAGFERTASHVRVPLDRQLAALLRRQRAVPLKKLRAHLAGVESAEELTHVVEWLRQTGALASVYADGSEQVTSAVDDVLSDAELEALAAFSEGLRALLSRSRTRRGTRRSLWRDDVAALFAQLGVRARSFVPRDRSVLDHLDALHAEGQRLVFVPDLVRRSQLDASEVHAALVAAAGAGQVELRPESGVNTLRAEDAALCLRDGDVCLSYVRRIEPAPRG